ncbi:deoxyribodipyrimidine photo-lyase [Flammeovirga sp. EKP202]|uniref:cryptochrome/photolyase family protein n=1 Tax=Flammeovirga sp. EKP202 TaxID=2770592 RepID=UPI00165FF4DF|nr:deoxyribodipyrimidine photo-lyase [Flammeovirga sp. EKP202]MBD0400675.1 deoxyribodipyrimidine photo-lyase [Flammeovirga sp. EKP202]
MKKDISIFWYRRDLRLFDNAALSHALKNEAPTLLLFIFDTDIINELDRDDARISFIYDQLNKINKQLNKVNSGLLVKMGKPLEVYKELDNEFNIKGIYTNEDYEPYAIKRDQEIGGYFNEINIPFHLFKDQVIFAKNEVLKKDGKPYTVFTPFKNQWLKQFDSSKTLEYKVELDASKLIDQIFEFPTLEDIGFVRSEIKVLDYKIDHLDHYDTDRDIPSKRGTSNLSVHLRFGTVSVRELVHKVQDHPSFFSELIWREFFMQILWHFPDVINTSFKKKYDHIEWRNNEADFEKWKNGQTGYPIVDAGMRELNATGYMHNRVRMVVASFLCKHLLIDWRWGEAYFAKKLLDFELSSNNGNWQWAAGTGCDAAPYFRVFNPTAQTKKFDPDFKYIKKWVPEFDGFGYPQPMVDHKMARERALDVYKYGLAMSEQ